MAFYYDVLLITALGFLAFSIILNHGTSEGSASNYGGDWTNFVEDYGDSLVLNFTTILNHTEDFIVGDAYFYLYTRNNIKEPEDLEPEINKQLNSVYFNKSNDVRILTHGWRTGANTVWLQNLKNAFLREYDINVITVDWYELSKNEIYPLAAISTRYVGSRVAGLIRSLAQTYSLSGQNIHLIGHSLGAHVMGYAGMFSEQKIFRITGLDPARPLFEIPVMPPDFRLDKSDAEFVDIIHTSGGVYGYRRSYGHADFYPNNGLPMQPGCNGIKQAIDACSHSRSHEYFEESIEYKSEEGFIAYVCDSWEDFNGDKCKDNPTTSMGYPASSKSNGNYYLRTRNESKFADITVVN